MSNCCIQCMKTTLLFLFTILSLTAATAQTGVNPRTTADTSNFTLTTPKGSIYGTLLLPTSTARQQPASAAHPVPIVLIIAGSGPTDRNGNALKLGLNTNCYLLLADSLQAHGIASLRYDKRGIGASSAAMASESDIRFDDYISDAVGFINMLKTDHRFSRVIVFGHSEGSLIGMVAAARGHANAYISAAGAGDRIDKIIERQLAAQSAQLTAKATVLFDSLGMGHTVQDPGNGLSGLFRTSVQPYMISWLKYNPQQEIRQLHIPILIIQGTTDLQVSTGDAELLKTAAPAATLQLIDQMNHVFREAPLDRMANMATYQKPDLPLKPELVKAIVSFVQATGK
jgi:pimeloyl-ACP methyl ester carboxylesterase